MKTVVFDSLPYGRSNAIPWRDLALRLGFKSKRELQKQIESERKCGYVILTDFSGGGYFKSTDPSDLKQFIRTMEAKARNTRNAIISAERELNKATGQTAFDGW